MPHLACWACGRQIYTTAPIQALFAEERRCPRCGAQLSPERREVQRRDALRRQNPPEEPGPPTAEERRAEDRRRDQRRKGPVGTTTRPTDDGSRPT